MRRSMPLPLAVFLVSCGGAPAPTTSAGSASTEKGLAVSTPATPFDAAAAAVAVAGTCTAPFTVLPVHPDTFIDQAAAAPAQPAGAWSVRPMTGPVATLDPGCTELARVPAAPPFEAIVHCTTGKPTRPLGPDNVSAHLLAVRTAAGWWTTELVRESWPHDATTTEARIAEVKDLTAQDRLGDAGVEITAIVEDGRPGSDKTRAAYLCGVGPSQAPSCAKIRVAAGRPFGAGSMRSRLTLGCDGTLELAGWEGGAPVALVHGRYTLAFP